MNMPVSKVIICEKSGQWATRLRWTGLVGELKIVETRSLLDCRHELTQSPASFLLLEAKRSNLEGVLRLLWEAHDSYPLAATVVLASRDLSDWEGHFREAGATHVAVSPRRLDVVARMAIAHLGRIPQPHLAERDAIWASLPLSPDD